MAEAIREHGTFTLLVRDAPSFAFAQRHFYCDVRPCPDAALYLGRFQRAAPKADILALLRKDHERVRESAPLPPGVLGLDWVEGGAGEGSLMGERVESASRLPRERTETGIERGEERRGG